MKTLREMMDQLDEISRRDVLRGVGGIAISPALNAMAHDYDTSDKELQLLAMLMMALWVCKAHSLKDVDLQCSQINAGLWDYAAKRKWTRKELNGFYQSATQGIQEKLKNPQWIEIITDVIASPLPVLKLLNKELDVRRPFGEASPDAMSKIDELFGK